MELSELFKFFPLSSGFLVYCESVCCVDYWKSFDIKFLLLSREKDSVEKIRAFLNENWLLEVTADLRV